MIKLSAHTLEEAIELIRNSSDSNLDLQTTWLGKTNAEILVRWLTELNSLRQYSYAIDEARQFLPR